MLFLWLKRFIFWNTSGDTLSRSDGGGATSVMATWGCHMYRRWQRLASMRVGASAQTCLWVSIFIRCVGRNPIMTLSVRINNNDLSRYWLERRQHQRRPGGVSQKAFTCQPEHLPSPPFQGRPPPHPPLLYPAFWLALKLQVADACFWKEGSKFGPPVHVWIKTKRFSRRLNRFCKKQPPPPHKTTVACLIGV